MDRVWYILCGIQYVGFWDLDGIDTTISSKGQVTVPRDVRERLGLQAGDKIAWSMLSNGTIVLRPKTRRLVDLVGILTRPEQSGVSVDEMRLPE